MEIYVSGPMKQEPVGEMGGETSRSWRVKLGKFDKGMRDTQGNGWGWKCPDRAGAARIWGHGAVQGTDQESTLMNREILVPPGGQERSLG